MKRNHIVLIIVCGLAVVLLLIISNSYTPKQKKINWSETYSNEDKIPYGAYVFYNMLSASFNGQKITAYNKPLDQIIEENAVLDKRTNMFLINYSFSPDEKTTNALISYVSAGNNVFISAYSISGELEDRLGIKTSNEISIKNPFDSSICNFINPVMRSNPDYHFKTNNYQTYFSSPGRGEVNLLGSLGGEKAINFIRIKYGDGYFYLNTSPYAFSNISMLSGRNWEYAMKCISYLPVRDIIWEDKSIVMKNSSNKRASDNPLSFIMSQPS